MSWFKRILGLGGGEAATPAEGATVEHAGFRITPTPLREGATWRIGARIEKEVGGETRTHELIRADRANSREEADDASVAKAKLAIDQLGDGLFR